MQLWVGLVIGVVLWQDSHCCRLHHGCEGNITELVLEAVVSIEWSSSSCVMKGMGVWLVEGCFWVSGVVVGLIEMLV